MSERIRNLSELTPVEERAGILFKRDDLLQPFDDVPVNGTKLRQCNFLFEDKLERISIDHNGFVATATSVHSPQGAIVARVAREFGLHCIIAIGGNERSRQHSTVRWCERAGAEVRIVSKLGYTSALNSQINKMPEHPFLVNFGMNAVGAPRAIVQSTAKQVENVPRDIDNIVFAVGSGIVMSGALLGLQLFGIKPKRIIGIQIAGVDRDRRIGELSNRWAWEYELHLDKSHPYSRELHVEVDGLELDPIYEAKAFAYMKDKLKLSGKTLFWVVGNSAPLRK
jgi:1-aminocyclopropane-1-carboxylate deaminase/D-cysteine desulfhydrase-like pyridoxal-dependent ACC family enzyme